jgi:hypothetical protein
MSWILWTMSYIAYDLRVRKGLEGPKTEDDSVAWYKEHSNDLNHRLPLLNVPEIIEARIFILLYRNILVVFN